MRWLIPGAVLCAACTPWWAAKSRQVSAAAATTSEAARAAGDLAQLARDMPAAIEKCRELAGSYKAAAVAQASYSVSDVADRTSRAAALVAKASENCAPPISDTLRLCVMLAGERANTCAPTLVADGTGPPVVSAVAVESSQPVALVQPVRAAVPTPRSRAYDVIAALAEYNLSDSEARVCGAIAIAAYSTRRMQVDQMRLAAEYVNSVSEDYLASVAKQTTSAESRLMECRRRNRSTPFEVPPVSPR
jgi:hypothetical protein